MKRAFLLLSLLVSAPALSAEPTVEELLDATDDINRGESSHSVVEMQVKTARYERTMSMEAWSEGEERTLIRILSPSKDAGVTTLKVDDDMWNYMPKVDRTMKVPPGMMSGNWMGSHFTNDDLVRSNRLAENFTYSITSKPDQNEAGVYVIELIPKPDAPVVWGKVVVSVRADKIPVDIKYYSEDNELERTMQFSDVRDFSGRLVPATMTLIPGDSPGEFTRITTKEMQFDVEIDDSFFSLQNLKR